LQEQSPRGIAREQWRGLPDNNSAQGHKLHKRNYSPCHCEEASRADEAISTLRIWGLLRKKRSQ